MPLTETPPLVLVVEDEALLLFSVADDLRDAGYHVLEATNADDAIVLLADNPEIKLLFTDIDMPGSMDGLKLSGVVSDRYPPVRIIVTSGKHAPGADRLPAGGLFMPKPYSSNAVVEVMGRLLAA